MSEYVLGITGIKDFNHDNSAVIIKDGNILFAASEESACPDMANKAKYLNGFSDKIILFCVYIAKVSLLLSTPFKL